jgi:valyl-tRNA synthetase
MDWVLSRRRYYGTEVPLWYCKKCGYVHVPEPGKYYQPWREKAPIEKCPKCGCTEFIGEERTFDTWFDSSSSEAYIMGYMWDRPFFDKNFPCSMRPQGKEIVRTWLYYTFLKSFHLYGKAPFKDCWIHMHIVDDTGIKMSKSLGNVIDPQEVMKKFGAEAFRVWSTLEGDITKGDIRCSFERIEGNSKFLTKLWNVARFISMFPIEEGADLTETDKWILSELKLLSETVGEHYDNYAFSDVANSIRNFVWDTFASNYLEMVKKRAYGQDMPEAEVRSARYTLHLVMKTVLKLLSPIAPFITDYIWRNVYGNESISKEIYPTFESDFGLEKLTGQLLEFNSAVWKAKKDRGMSLAEEIEIEIPKELKVFSDDLVRMHNVR